MIIGLKVLNQFIQSNDKGSPFVLQILGLALGFAGRAFKTFPDCATIFNLIYEWQDLLPVECLQPLPVEVDRSKEQLYRVWEDMDEYHVIEHALLHNRLPLGAAFVTPPQSRLLSMGFFRIPKRFSEIIDPFSITSPPDCSSSLQIPAASSFDITGILKMFV